MKRISEESIAAVRERSDLLTVVEEHVAMKRAGSAYKGLCPFHDERTPSFTVNTMTGTWKCYGCGAGGDAIDFLQEIEGEGFRWAVESLAERFGIELKEGEAEEVEDGEREKKSRLHQVNDAAAEFFAEQLLNTDEGEGARSELRRRHFDPATAAADFGCGYAPLSSQALINYLRKMGFKDDEIVTAGLANKTERGSLRPRFRGRLVWAIRNSFGKGVGFGARRLRDDDPIEAKFINTSETPIYKKSEVFYGFDKARKAIARTNHAIVVEGYTDVMAMHLSGVENAVATCGTAFTPQHLSVLRRIVGESGEITFALDDDAAGRKATMAIYDIAKESVRRLTALQPSEGMDPDDYRQAHGNDALADLLSTRRPLLQTVIASTVNSHPTQSPEDRLVALDAVIPLLGHAPDPLLRKEYASMVARMLHFATEDVLSRLGALPTPSAPGQRETVDPPASLDPEREVIKMIVQDEAAARELIDLVRWNVHYPVSSVILDAAEDALDDPSAMKWVLKVRSRCTDRAATVVDQIMGDPPPVTSDKAVQYASEMAGRLDALARTREKEGLMRALRDGATPEERDRAFKRLMEMDDD